MNPVVSFLTAFGEVMILVGKTLREFFRPPFELDLTLEQLERGGVDSWSLTFLTAIFTGMVMASQFAVGLEPFGATPYTGKIVAGLIGMVRDGTIGSHENVLFLHTGGMPSLFAYEDVLR